MNKISQHTEIRTLLNVQISAYRIVLCKMYVKKYISIYGKLELIYL